MLKNLLWFAAGAVIGAVAGYFLGQEMAEEGVTKRINKQLEAAEEYYNAKAGTLKKELEIEKQKLFYAEGLLKANNVKYDDLVDKFNETERVSNPITQEERSMIVPEPPPDMTPAPYYEAEGGPMIFPTEPESKPYVINEQQYSDGHPEYEKASLIWYTVDDVVTDDDGDEVDEEDYLIGFEWRNSFDRDPDCPNYTYVRNPRIACDYEILRLHRRYLSGPAIV